MVAECDDTPAETEQRCVHQEHNAPDEADHAEEVTEPPASERQVLFEHAGALVGIRIHETPSGGEEHDRQRRPQQPHNDHVEDVWIHRGKRGSGRRVRCFAGQRRS